MFSLGQTKKNYNNIACSQKRDYSLFSIKSIARQVEIGRELSGWTGGGGGGGGEGGRAGSPGV